MKQITKYEADDGTLFDTAEAARTHEETIAFRALLCLDEHRLMLALQRHHDALEVADALELAGNRIAKQRRESGELKRERKAKGAEPETVGETAPVETEEAPGEDPTKGLPL